MPLTFSTNRDRMPAGSTPGASGPMGVLVAGGCASNGLVREAAAAVANAATAPRISSRRLSAWCSAICASWHPRNEPDQMADGNTRRSECLRRLPDDGHRVVSSVVFEMIVVDPEEQLPVRGHRDRIRRRAHQERTAVADPCDQG